MIDQLEKPMTLTCRSDLLDELLSRLLVAPADSYLRERSRQLGTVPEPRTRKGEGRNLTGKINCWRGFWTSHSRSQELEGMYVYLPPSVVKRLSDL